MDLTRHAAMESSTTTGKCTTSALPALREINFLFEGVDFVSECKLCYHRQCSLPHRINLVSASLALSDSSRVTATSESSIQCQVSLFNFLTVSLLICLCEQRGPVPTKQLILKLSINRFRPTLLKHQQPIAGLLHHKTITHSR